jgi:hypothetical protein
VMTLMIGLLVSFLSTCVGIVVVEYSLSSVAQLC